MSVAAAELAAPDTPLPPLGEVIAQRDEKLLLRVLANQAPRGAIVSALSEAADFALVLGDGADLSEPLTLRAVGEPLEVVLARVLAGVPHALEYEEGEGSRRLVRLTLGAAGSAPAVASAPSSRAERRRRLQQELTPEERRERAERAERLWASSLENVASPDVEVRADAVTWLDVSSPEGFQAATQLLVSDPAPEVRAAAAETLGESDVGAVQPLLQALGDPDPRVVIATLDALEFVGDASTIPHLTPLLEHKDVEVRERTVEAIQFLQ